MVKRGVVGIDLGGTNLRVGFVRDNKILRLVRRPTPTNKNILLKLMYDLIHEVGEENFYGVGIASPGPLKDGILINPPNIPFKNFNMKNYFQKMLKIRVEVDNDAKCAALAEVKLGWGRGKKNFFILTLGTGVGGGVVINGQVYNEGDIGSELGSIYLTSEKRFEEFVGGKAIEDITIKKFGRAFNISELMKMRDKKAREIIQNISDHFAQGIGSLINVFNPEIVILTGGIREAGEEFLDIVREKVERYIILPKKYEIVWSKLQEPGLLGAGLLID